MTSDMSDTHYHGEEISADTYATLRRNQFNLESPEERLQRIENTIATMKEKWRRGDEAMRDFTVTWFNKRKEEMDTCFPTSHKKKLKKRPEYTIALFSSLSHAPPLPLQRSDALAKGIGLLFFIQSYPAMELMSSVHGRLGPLSLGRFPLVQAGYLIKGRFPFVLWQGKSLGLEAGGRTQTRRQGPRPGGRNPEPGGRNPEAGGRNPEAGTSARSLSHQTPLSIVLGCTCGQSERIHSLIGDISPGEWAVILDSIHTRGLDQVGHVDVVVPLIPMAWKWIIRKNHHDETSPPWWGLVGVGRKFDGETGNVCIKGDVSAHNPDSYAAPVAILGLRGTFSMFVLLVGDNLVDSWYWSRIPGHVRETTSNARMALCRAFLEDHGHVFPESEDLKIHTSETHGSWVPFFINRRLYGLSSRNLEIGWTLSWNPEAGWNLVLEPGGWMDSRPGTWGCRVNPFFKPVDRYHIPPPFVSGPEAVYNLEVFYEPGGHFWTRRSCGNPEYLL
ncbi:hypothetical protein F2Q69_00036371 [Brassica cretica]|uniref:Uncharacterized protein n=1 Tax=Brassica cretica TaxID=69181 RepID=A0A8S9SNE0_BRACR|nr:hypothetical protein F2Q69_00036371 [Brassica cretica]